MFFSPFVFLSFSLLVFLSFCFVVFFCLCLCLEQLKTVGWLHIEQFRTLKAKSWMDGWMGWDGMDGWDLSQTTTKLLNAHHRLSALVDLQIQSNKLLPWNCHLDNSLVESDC